MIIRARIGGVQNILYLGHRKLVGHKGQPEPFLFFAPEGEIVDGHHINALTKGEQLMKYNESLMAVTPVNINGVGMAEVTLPAVYGSNYHFNLQEVMKRQVFKEQIHRKKPLITGEVKPPESKSVKRRLARQKTKKTAKAKPKKVLKPKPKPKKKTAKRK